MADPARLAGASIPIELTPGEPAQVAVRGVADRLSLRAWLTEHREAVRAAVRDHGHLLVRGLPLDDKPDFALARDLLVDRPATHAREETTARSAYGDGLFSATDLPPPQEIGLHQEDSYSVVVPGLLLFCCFTAAASGGATTVCDVRSVVEAVPGALLDRLRRCGWLVVRNFSEHFGVSWQDAFGSTERAAVERHCSENLIGWEWLPGNGLRTTALRSATLRHPATGAETWFNHIAVFSEHSYDAELRSLLLAACGRDGLPQNTYHGDGSPFSEADITTLNQAYLRAKRRVGWRPGDLLIIDNLLCAHGREPYAGERQVLVAMGDSLDVRDCRPSGPIGPGPLTPGEEGP